MNKINRIIIENFQSHENTVLDFAGGLNVITGPSDQGKSAIIRALRWVLYNEPRGMDFIRHGASMARVRIELSNGYVITRERSKSKNRYIISSKEKEDMVFEGFGNDVPEEVMKAHGMPKVLLDNDMDASLNMGTQLEAPFLLSEPGSVRAKAIGRLTGLHIIDKAIRDCINDLRKESQKLDRLEKEVETVNQKLTEYDKLDDIEAVIEQTSENIKMAHSKIQFLTRLEEIKAGLERTASEQQSLTGLLNKLGGISQCEWEIKECEIAYFKLTRLSRINSKIADVEAGISEAEEVIKNTENVDEALGILNRTNELLSLYNDLIKYRGQLEECDLRLKKANDFLSGTAGVYVAEKIIRDIEEKRILFDRLTGISERYQSVMDNIKDGEKHLNENKADLGILTKKYSSLLRQLRICPLCGSEVNEKCLDNILKGYEEVN